MRVILPLIYPNVYLQFKTPVCSLKRLESIWSHGNVHIKERFKQIINHGQGGGIRHVFYLKFEHVID